MTKLEPVQDQARRLLEVIENPERFYQRKLVSEAGLRRALERQAGKDLLNRPEEELLDEILNDGEAFEKTVRQVAENAAKMKQPKETPLLPATEPKDLDHIAYAFGLCLRHPESASLTCFQIPSGQPFGAEASILGMNTLLLNCDARPSDEGAVEIGFPRPGVMLAPRVGIFHASNLPLRSRLGDSAAMMLLDAPAETIDEVTDWLASALVGYSCVHDGTSEIETLNLYGGATLLDQFFPTALCSERKRRGLRRRGFQHSFISGPETDRERVENALRVKLRESRSKAAHHRMVGAPADRA